MATSRSDHNASTQEAPITRHSDPQLGTQAPEGHISEPPPAHPDASKLAARRKREAEALRANLRKRKDQARAREKPKQE
jgi:hypothetical protein